MSRQSLQFHLNPQGSAIGLFPPTIVTYSLNNEEEDYNHLLKLKINDTILKPFCKFYKLDARALIFTSLNYDYIPVTLNANTILENIANTEQLNVHQLIIKVNFLDTLEFDANGHIVDIYHLSSIEQQQDNSENRSYLQFSLKLSGEDINDDDEELDIKKVEKKSLVLDEKLNIIDFSGSEHKQNWPTIKLRLREFNLHQQYQLTIAKFVCAYCAYVLLSTQHNSETFKSFEGILEYFSKFKYLILTSQHEALVVLNNEFTDVEPKLSSESSIPSPAPSESYDSHNELVNSIEKLLNSSSFKSNPQLHKNIRDVKILQNAILKVYTVDNYSDFILQNFSKVNEQVNANANSEQEISSANLSDPEQKTNNSSVTTETTRTHQLSAEIGVPKKKLEKQETQIQNEEVLVLETEEISKQRLEKSKKEKETEANEEMLHDSEKSANQESRKAKVFDMTTELPFSVFKNVAMDFADFTKKTTQVETTEKSSKSLDELGKEKVNANDTLKPSEKSTDVQNLKDGDKDQDFQCKTGKLSTKFLYQSILENNVEDVAKNESKKNQQNERVNQSEIKDTKEINELESKKDNFLLARFLDASELSALNLDKNESHPADTKGDSLNDVQAIDIGSDDNAQPFSPEEHVIDISTPAPSAVPNKSLSYQANSEQEKPLVEIDDKSTQKKSGPITDANGFVDSFAYESDDVELVLYTKPEKDSNMTQKSAVTIKKEPLTTSKAALNSDEVIASSRLSKRGPHRQPKGSAPNVFDIESSDSDVTFQEDHHKRDLSPYKFDTNGYTCASANGKKINQQGEDSNVQIEESDLQMVKLNQDALQDDQKTTEPSSISTKKQSDQNNENNTESKDVRKGKISGFEEVVGESDIQLENQFEDNSDIQLEENQPEQESIVSQKKGKYEKKPSIQLEKSKFGNGSNVQVKENQSKQVTTVPLEKKQHKKGFCEQLDIDKSGDESDVQLEESRPENVTAELSKKKWSKRQPPIESNKDQLEKELPISLAKDDSTKESAVQLEESDLPKKSSTHLKEENVGNQAIKSDSEFDAHSDKQLDEESDIEFVEKEEEVQNESRKRHREQKNESLFKLEQKLKPLIKKAKKPLRQKRAASGGSETKRGIPQTRSSLPKQSAISKVDILGDKNDDFHSVANGLDFEVVSSDYDEINSLASTDKEDQISSRRQSRNNPYGKPRSKLLEKSKIRTEAELKSRNEFCLKSGLRKEREEAQIKSVSSKAGNENWSTRKHLRELSKTKPQTRLLQLRREKPHHRRKDFAEAEIIESDAEIITDLVSLSSSSSEFAIESNSDSEVKLEVQSASSSSSESDIEFVQKPSKRQKVSKLPEKKISLDTPKQEKRARPKKLVLKKASAYKPQELKRGTKLLKDLNLTRKRLRERPLKDHNDKNLFSELLPKKHRSNNLKISDLDIEFEGQHSVSEDNAVQMEEQQSLSEDNKADSGNESSDFEMLSKSRGRPKKLHPNSRNGFTGTYKRHSRKAEVSKKQKNERTLRRALRIPLSKRSISERRKPGKKLLLDALTTSDEGSDDASIEFEPVRLRSSAGLHSESKPVVKLKKKPKSAVELEKKVKPTKKLLRKFAGQDTVSSDLPSDVVSVVAPHESSRERKHKESTLDKGKKDKELQQKKRKDSSDEFEVLNEVEDDSEVIERKNDHYRKNRLRNNDATRKNISSSLALFDQPLSGRKSHNNEKKSLIQNILHQKNLSFKDKIKEIFKSQASDEEDLDNDMLLFIAED